MFSITLLSLVLCLVCLCVLSAYSLVLSSQAAASAAAEAAAEAAQAAAVSSTVSKHIAPDKMGLDQFADDDDSMSGEGGDQAGLQHSVPCGNVSHSGEECVYWAGKLNNVPNQFVLFCP